MDWALEGSRSLQTIWVEVLNLDGFMLTFSQAVLIKSFSPERAAVTTAASSERLLEESHGAGVVVHRHVADMKVL